jgi:hypothetical protein
VQYSDIELERRMERVRVLLETHDDIYDDLSRPETAQAGFGEPRRRTYLCGSCGGKGCGQCERSAARASEFDMKLKRGRVLVEERDPYDTGLEAAFDPHAKTQRDRAKLIDDTIDRLQELELVRQGIYATGVGIASVLEKAAARDSRGSYRELRAALDAMPRGLHGDAAARWIARWIPGRIRVPRWAYELELERIEEQVLELKDGGLDVSEIADELAISKRQVRNALRAAKR